MSAQAAPPNNTDGEADAKPNQNAATALVGSYVLDGAHVVTIDEALRAEGVASLTYIRGADAYGQAGGPADPKDLPAAVALAKESTPSVEFDHLRIRRDKPRPVNSWLEQTLVLRHILLLLQAMCRF